MVLPPIDRVRKAFVAADIPTQDVWHRCNLSPGWQSRFRNAHIVNPDYTDICNIIAMLVERGHCFE